MNWKALALFAATLIGATLPGYGVDWPQYRGPSHDGSTPEAIRTDWAANPPSVLWKKTIGPGWSSISVAQGRAVTQEKRILSGERREVVVALDVASGTELWSTPVDSGVYRQSLSGEAPDALDGPRTTPSLVGDFVYISTSNLKVYCLRVQSGEIVWSRDFATEFGASIIPWSHSASPLVVGDLLYLNTNVKNNTLTALRVADGSTAWAVETDAATHASPSFTTLDNTPQIIFLTLRGLVGVTPENGDVLWRYNFVPSSTSTAATPLVVGNWVYASCAYGKGAWTTQVGRQGGNFSVSQSRFQQGSLYQNHWATPVAHEGALYSIVERGSDRSLVRYDLDTRANRWQQEIVGSTFPGYASLIKAGSTLVVLTETGELVLVKPGTTYDQIGQFKALEAYCWNQPTVANGRLFARSSSEIIALDVATEAVTQPIWNVRPSVAEAGSELILTIVGSDGTPPSMTVAQRSALHSSTDGGVTWNLVTATWKQAGDQVFTSLPLDGTSKLLRFRVHQ